MTLFTVEDIARSWNVTTATVHRWARAGRLRGVVSTPGGALRFTEEAMPPGLAGAPDEEPPPADNPADGRDPRLS